MIHNQIQIVKSALIIVFSLLTLFTIKATFEDENLLWMPVILLPLLILSFYQFSQQKYPVLWKYPIMRQILASERGRKVSTNTLPPTRLKKNDLAFIIGNKNDPQSYKAGVFNIRIRNKAVKSLADNSFQSQTYFSDDANIYDLIEGDRILHVGPEYTGCQTKKGGFDREKFKELASESKIKIIELDLSTPCNPFRNVISTIGNTFFSVSNNRTGLSTLGYTMFSDADGMIVFLEKLHNLSNGKPVGIKLRIGSKKELYNICYAIQKANFNPHFIVVESEEQIGFRSSNDRLHIAMPIYEAVLFVAKTLEVYELDKKIKLIAAANILSGTDLLKLVSLGADAVWSEVSGYKIIKVNRDGTNESLVYDRRDLSEFYNNILNGAVQIMEANGLKSINDVTLSTFLSGKSFL